MILAELTEEIKPLSRVEKLKLIEAISQMLLDEDHGAQQYFDTNTTYPLFTPLHQEKAAAQLQQFLNQQKS
jgi:hypothetical protein